MWYIEYQSAEASPQRPDAINLEIYRIKTLRALWWLKGEATLSCLVCFKDLMLPTDQMFTHKFIHTRNSAVQISPHDVGSTLVRCIWPGRSARVGMRIASDSRRIYWRRRNQTNTSESTQDRGNQKETLMWRNPISTASSYDYSQFVDPLFAHRNDIPTPKHIITSLGGLLT